MEDAKRYIGRVLILDDDESVRRLYSTVLVDAGFEVDQVTDLRGLRDRMPAVHYDILLLDLELGDEHGLNGLAWALKEAPFTKVFVLTGHSTVARAVECMRRGASGFIEKGTPLAKVVAELTASLSRGMPSSQTPASGDGAGNYGLIGESDAVHETLSMLEKLRDVDSTVLILGESGTGKEIVARALHKSSGRAAERFAAINCGAIPEALLESELFGHRKGSFTDAKADRKGIFEICSRGTLLLDEIGDMPLALQAKLLRVLQERQVTPIGSGDPISINTRVIAATHRDILYEAKSRNFREDLYYRLSIVVLRIPPLRHRLEDVPILVQHFLAMFNQRFACDVRPPSHAAMSRLLAYDWPGNVRELRNAVERGVVLADNGELTIENMFQHLSATERIGSSSALVEGAGAKVPDEIFSMHLTEAKQAFEKLYLEHLLRQCGGNIADVSERSGRYRADVYRLMHRFGLEPGSFR